MRARAYGWQPPTAMALAGQTALVTGPTSGLGRSVAGARAALGARVVLAGRDEAKLGQLRQELTDAIGEDRYPTVVVDMAALASVRGAVEQVLASESRIDVLVDNAGAIYAERGLTDEGIERTLAVLAVGPWLLTLGLLPALHAAPAARVIGVTSGGMYTQPVHLDDLQWQARPYHGPRAYAHAKRIQVALMREWARRLNGSTVSFNAMHPGWADTPGLAESLPRFYGGMGPLLRTVEEGADTITWLATSTTIGPPGGRLYLDRRPRPFDRIPQTRLSAADRARLWRAVAHLAGVDGS